MVCIWDRAGQTTKNFDKRMFSVMKSLVHVFQDNYAEVYNIRKTMNNF